MSVHLMTEKITYVSAPKCACTSIKRFFFHVEHGHPYDRQSEGGRVIHKYYPTVPFGRLPQGRISDHYRFAVVRDPVARFVSTYDNKIASGMLSSAPEGRILRIFGLSTRPSLSEFFARLRRYQWVSPIIAKHTRPLVAFLGRRADWFHRVYDISEMSELEQDLHRRIPGSSDIGLRRANRSKTHSGAAQLTGALIDQIRALYADDYAAFGRQLKSNTAPASA